MQLTGTIHFPNDLSEQRWNGIVAHFHLEPTSEVEMHKPMFGGYITVKDPPNLLALFKTNKRARPGIIRCSRMFFDGGVGDTAEISFQGKGKKFARLVEEINDFVGGTLTLNETAG